jgi:uncharacterized protein DUF6152
MTHFKAALAAATVVALLSGMPVSAHHAVQASVDINNSVSAEGILVKVDWVNPHIWMHFDFTKPDGSVQKSVAVEGLGIAALRQVGITSRDALKIGQKFKINYYPFRSGQPGGFMNSMVLPDGRVFDVTNSDPTALQ